MIRIRCDAKNTSISLGAKFGCDPFKEAACLIQCTKDLGLNLHGFSFHVGTPCLEIDAYRRGIKMCDRLIGIAKTLGCGNVQLIDIGGGFESVHGKKLDMVCIFDLLVLHELLLLTYLKYIYNFFSWHMLLMAR